MTVTEASVRIALFGRADLEDIGGGLVRILRVLVEHREIGGQAQVAAFLLTFSGRLVGKALHLGLHHQEDKGILGHFLVLLLSSCLLNAVDEGFLVG